MSQRYSFTDVWFDDWEIAHFERIRSTGAADVRDFMKRNPAIPYHKLARQLGPTAARQLLIMQFKEATKSGLVREAAMDLLTRTINDDLRRGWKRGFHWKTNKVRAVSHFVCDLIQFTSDDSLRELGDSVWNALEGLGPPEGWLPRSIEDEYVVRAFAAAWPVDDHRTVKEEGP